MVQRNIAYSHGRPCRQHEIPRLGVGNMPTIDGSRPGLHQAGFTSQLRHKKALAVSRVLPKTVANSEQSLECRPDEDLTLTTKRQESRQIRQQVSCLWKARALQQSFKIVLGMALCLAIFSAGSSSAFAAEASEASGNILSRALHVLLHLDHHLAQIIGKYGKATYAILWGIVFCETGLVITPFLPAAILGDAVNYQLGKMLGARAKTSRLVKQEYLQKTENFYAQHGSKTIVLARFIPIVRTFAPFVAGVGAMDYKNFSVYNVAGALLWSGLFVGGGSLLGNVPAVKHNFSIVVFAIIGVSLLPVLFEVFQAKRRPESGEGDSEVTTYRFKTGS